MANEVRIHASTKDDASGPIDKIRDKVTKLKEGGKEGAIIGASAAITAKGLNVMTSAVDAASSAVINFGMDSINAASNLEQSAGAVESVFGDAAETVFKFGETADTSLGLSKRAVNELAAVAGAQLKSLGFSVDEAATKTLELEQRGADLAATFGGTTSDAVQAISSLLRGERDPIEKYGISIKQADVNARVLAMGLKTNTTEAKKNAEAIASLDLLMSQSADSAGQFARESDSLAGTQQALGAEIENLQAQIGEQLMPVARDLAKWAKDEAVPALKGLFETIEDNRFAIDVLAKALGFLTNAGGTTGDTIVELKRRIDEAGTVTRDAAQDAQIMDHAQQELADKLKGTRGALGGVDKAADGAAGGIEDVADEAKDAKKQLDDMRGAIRKAADALNEQKRGHEETNLKIKITKSDLRDAQDELHKLERIKDPTRDQRRSMNELRLKILEDQDEIATLRADLAASGKVNMSVTDSWLRRVRDDGSEAGDAIAYLNDELRKAGGGGGGGGPKPGPHKNSKGAIKGSADGGWVGLNGPELSWLGEKGPEYVIPNDQLRSGAPGLGGATININISTPVLTPGSAQALADAIGPAITRWQQMRGL